jgi:putative hydrolase of HD superfamily
LIARKIKTNSNTLHKTYNQNTFDPRDGELIKAVDHSAAFVEAYSSLQNGVDNNYLQEAVSYLYNKYKDENSNFSVIDFGAIYREFEKNHLVEFKVNSPLHKTFLLAEQTSGN